MSRRRRQRKRHAQRSALGREDKRVSIEQFVAERQGEGELSEDDVQELVWEMHPDLNRMRLRGTLPDELVDEEGRAWNPRMHIDMHTIVERQLALNEPEGIADLAIQFEREKKLDSHEIRHVLAAAIGEQLWHMMKQRQLFDSQRYFRDIRRLYNEFLNAKN